MRVIKGKIFLCSVIGGCRGNTRTTSASNYFQTLRIERALSHELLGNSPTHTFFPRLPASPPSPSPPATIFVSPKTTLSREPHPSVLIIDDSRHGDRFHVRMYAKPEKKERGWKKKKREEGNEDAEGSINSFQESMWM